MKKLKYIFFNAIPILIMISLIPFIENDYVLSLIYTLIIVAFLSLRRDEKDMTVFFLGVLLLTLSEAFFVSTGVETFTRRSLFELMPLWLPLLWGYAFVAIKRVVLVI